MSDDDRTTASSARHWRMGTRGSELALAQSGHVARAMQAAGACATAELVVIQTSGDRIQDRSLAAIGGKGLFIKELEEALLAGQVDVAIHSMKDLPGEVDSRFHVCTALERADPRDVLIGHSSLDALPAGAVVGTSSTRRGALVRHRRPDLQVKALRGNVGTRLRKLRDPAEGLHTTLLAAAGLQRLGLDVPGAPLDPADMLPAVTQGILAVQCLAERVDVVEALRAAEHAPTRIRAAAERGFLRRLGGSCTTPVAAYAELDGEGPNAKVWIRAVISSLDGADTVSGEAWGSADRAHELGSDLAVDLLQRGGARILRELEVAAQT